MARTPIRGDQGIGWAEQSARRFQVGDLAVGKDDCTGFRGQENTLLDGGCGMVHDCCSLRRHYPDQVLRVKDSRSFSQPGNTGLPVDDDKKSIGLSYGFVNIL